MNTVFGATLSPFVRKVQMALDYKGVDYRLEWVPPFDRSEGFAAVSPLRKIPAFRDESITISDSSVICDYLEQKYPEPQLYPARPACRARALWLEELADTRLHELLGLGIFFERVLRPRMFRRDPDERRVARAIAALPPHLEYLEGQLEVGGFAVGSRLSVADLIVPGVFLNASYAGYDVDDARWPRLAAYLKRAFGHPVYAARIAEEREFMATLPSRVESARRARDTASIETKRPSRGSTLR